MENVRLLTEKIEKETLSDRAVLSANTKGRKVFEDECDVRTAFQRDRDRIIHSRAFRRLKHKTQVFLAPESDHYRTRLTHTLEVSQIARTIARALRINEDLTEAIALGHDLGHTPFGHAGERVLIIDDLGTEVTNSFVTSQLFSCLNERHIRKKSTIISTNLSLEELRERYSDRIFSRISTNYKLCKLSGPDIRIKKQLM